MIVALASSAYAARASQASDLLDEESIALSRVREVMAEHGLPVQAIADVRDAEDRIATLAARLLVPFTEETA